MKFRLPRLLPTSAKGKLVNQDTYEWPFVVATRVQGRKWTIALFNRPNADRNGPHQYFTFEFHGSDRDVIEKGNEYNQRETEEWNELIKKARARKQKQHDEAARRGRGGHTRGPIKDCPVCTPTVRR